MILTRQDLEKREADGLAPYAARSAESGGRKYPEEEHPSRTDFQRDRDRVIHSTAFRRLEYKTQVFVNHEGDYYRTRLTHSMEVAQIARTVARTLNLNEDLAETLALAHDLGHTPFGHSGQDALHDMMKEHGGFEHNVQGLRVVELLENSYPNFRGLNLTWATRESMRKHTVRPDFPLEPEYKPEWQPLLECQAVDVADSIGYDAHDVDDGIKAGLITEEALNQTALWREGVDDVKKKFPKADGEIRVKQAVIAIINREVGDLLEQTEKMFKKFSVHSVEDVRRAPQKLVAFSPEMDMKKRELQQFLFKNMYWHYRVARMAEKAKRFITELFQLYVKNIPQLPPRFQEWAKEVGVHRAVADYIAGMTDRYAQDEYKKLFYPFERV